MIAWGWLLLAGLGGIFLGIVISVFIFEELVKDDPIDRDEEIVHRGVLGNWEFWNNDDD